MKYLLSSFAAALLLLAPAMVSAQTLGITATIVATSSAPTKAETLAKTRADTEIDRRITILNAVQARISAMTRVDATEKTSLSSTISTQISAMTSLKAQIDAETVIANLKTEIQSITKAYRIFMLVVPQARITAAGDRALSIVADMQTLSVKLNARITADTSGNAASLETSYTDMQAKITDANLQATLAISEVATLQPDNGDATIEASNTTALKDARSKILAATTDLKAAYADAQTIIQGVKGTGSASTIASTSTSIQ